MMFDRIHLLARSLNLLRVALLLSAAAGPGTVLADESPVPVYDYRIVNSYPHNPRFFTQGLLIHGGELYEGTGRYGESVLVQTNLEDGSVVRSRPLSSRYFGEGIAVADGRIYQLTWRENTVFVYDLDSLEPLDPHYLPTEGWGLTFDGEHLILSDGSDQLYFIDPETFQTVKRLTVTLKGQSVRNLNELEFIDAEVWANVWMAEQLVRIDPDSGDVRSIVDLSGLKEQTQLGGREAVLNGIAWDEQHERLFVTGKLWANLFEITLHPRQ